MHMEGLRERREARRRALRRRRAFALLALAGVIAAAIVALASAGGSSTLHERARANAAPAAGSGRHASSRAALHTATRTGPPGRQAIPILMYHVIAHPPAGAPFPGLYVAPAEFAEQMRALKRAGWHAVTLDQIQASWRSGAPLGAGKPIVLTFDNGYQSQYTKALPVLRSLGWVGNENIQLSGLPPSQGGLTPEQVRGLVAAGWELDTQGFNHADLITLDAAQLHYQVAVTRTTLQRRYGVPVNWFCYPSGHYDATVIAAVRAAGYAGSTTVIPGWASPREDRYRLHRLRVLGGTGPQALLSLIASSSSDAPAPASYGGA